MDKFVVLVDTDGKEPDVAMASLRQRLPQRVQDLGVPVLIAYARPHLEAWFFGDSQALRRYLGRDLGTCDPSHPDQIQNPKQHLKQLLGGRVYTSRVSEEIAERLDGSTVLASSPSFRGFVEALRNGH